MSRSIKILDQNQQLIGKMINASDSDILTYIAKGFVVVDKKTNEVITESSITENLGVSDGSIILG